MIKLPQLPRVHSYRTDGSCSCKWVGIHQLAMENDDLPATMRALGDDGYRSAWNHAIVIKQCVECERGEIAAERRDMAELHKAAGK